MSRKYGKKHLAAAFLCGTLFFSGLSYAATQSIDVSFPQLKFFVNGEDKTPAAEFDNNGTKVPSSLIYEGTTYVPLRMVGQMVTEAVYWDGNTSSVSIGQPHVLLTDAAGKSLGSAVLTAAPQGVSVKVSVSGLTPGLHGIHVHESAIQGSDFKTAGGHFNPEGKKHGHDNPEGAHIGDLVNLEVKADGTAEAELLVEGATLTAGDEHSLLGKSLIIHAAADDYKTDPSGNSGDRIAGGNIPQ
ncbi:superoxide dismutase family protein [Paenibacillus mucilaginosus]|uniref:Superoxide dismutase copper/zinc binding protein n=3 Tax=Paenibacillus mucilaginosus TaxID=61624 RepID=H6NBX1_9BACL|nr:superoxide dismutase family protein [Paenibacillus mucilaginosus]AEI42209.1 superoxide dismutase copper/zinc binding protein [Paenibacillus mucilaginosus KNP414]AFC28003.1 superoxide dismutase copper/zinc binding protein [Paenibacillus mucilaginosus 3016]AFH60168.1 superoxide dismutase [Paenibacillus mucilaginosus K02]AFK65367.1 superoxide dismutase copper/zinc binding protein [Paenibacillus mucilaginosus K02]MCG7214175.1 superoxide dismutase family protein [Paenibacillus mucilaginosus]